MSILPAAEALQRLENDGLVESRPRVGTRVKIPTPIDIRGHYVVHEALETQAARLFATKASEDERLELRDMAEGLDAMYANQPKNHGPSSAGPMKNYWFQFLVCHTRFHMRIAECAGVRALCDAIEKNQILTFNWLYDAASEPRIPPGRGHAELAQALAQRDEEIAATAMRSHVRCCRDEVLNRLESLVLVRLTDHTGVPLAI